MNMPNFLIIGAGKSGTTSLYEYLKQHPQIFMSALKEPHFLSYEASRPAYQGPLDEKWFNSKVITELKDYQKLFANVTNEKAIGEASTSYLINEKAAERIKHHLPNSKLIAILRHPAERAYSAYMMLVSRGYEPCMSFREALDAEKQRIRENWYLPRYVTYGFYYEYLKRYYELFSPDQIQVFLYEDLKNNPLQVSKEMYKFLEVDENFIPDVNFIHNVSSGIPRNRVLHKLLNRPNPLKTIMRPMIPDGIRQRIRGNSVKKPGLSPDLRSELSATFHEDIVKLENLIDRNLSSWLT